LTHRISPPLDQRDPGRDLAAAAPDGGQPPALRAPEPLRLAGIDSGTAIRNPSRTSSERTQVYGEYRFLRGRVDAGVDRGLLQREPDATDFRAGFSIRLD